METAFRLDNQEECSPEYERKTSKHYIYLKRMFDLTIAFFSLFLFIPLYIVVAIAIKLDSRGSIIFRQKRCGINGKIFYMYKFRSMTKDAESILYLLNKKNETGGCMFKMKRDPRVTRIGWLLRKTSIDELPQIINVIRGEMSIVGPRPPLPCEVENYDSYQMQRLHVLPGITGLWQISGRSSLGFDEMVELDIKYIKNRSIFYDFKIFLRTIPCLLGDKNAY